MAIGGVMSTSSGAPAVAMGPLLRVVGWLLDALPPLGPNAWIAHAIHAACCDFLDWKGHWGATFCY